MEISTMTTILMASMNVWNADGNFAYNAEMDGEPLQPKWFTSRAKTGNTCRTT